MDRAQKAESIETLKGVFANAGAVVVTHYMGLTVAQMTTCAVACARKARPSRWSRTAWPTRR